RKAEQDAPERREAAGERQQHEERKAEGFCQQCVRIGADRVERHVAEIEQAGEPNHDVEAETEHHIDQDLDAEMVDPFYSAAEAAEGEGEGGKAEEEGGGAGREPAPAPPTRPRGIAVPRGGAPRAPPPPRQYGERIDEPAAGRERNKDEQQRPARVERELVV